MSAGGSARQTLNIQCADCGRGRRPSGRPGVPSGAGGDGGMGAWLSSGAGSDPCVLKRYSPAGRVWGLGQGLLRPL